MATIRLARSQMKVMRRVSLRGAMYFDDSIAMLTALARRPEPRRKQCILFPWILQAPKRGKESCSTDGREEFGIISYIQLNLSTTNRPYFPSFHPLTVRVCLSERNVKSAAPQCTTM